MPILDSYLEADHSCWGTCRPQALRACKTLEEVMSSYIDNRKSVSIVIAILTLKRTRLSSGRSSVMRRIVKSESEISTPIYTYQRWSVSQAFKLFQASLRAILTSFTPLIFLAMFTARSFWSCVIATSLDRETTPTLTSTFISAPGIPLSVKKSDLTLVAIHESDAICLCQQSSAFWMGQSMVPDDILFNWKLFAQQR